MSVEALRPSPTGAPGVRRVALALGAVLLVAAAGWIAAFLLAPAAPPTTVRNPFGGGVREAAPAASGLGAWLLGWQSAFFALLRERVAALGRDGAALPVLMGLGFAYGVLHAAGPGHGKAVISAYLLANERSLRRGLALSAAAALVQALVAIALVTVVFGIVGGTAAALGRVAGAVEAAGFALVAALGAVLAWRKAGRLAAILGPDAAGPAVPDEPCCAVPHGPPPDGSWRDGSWRDGLAVALGAGIRPCAGAIVLLTLARSQGAYPAGIAATFAMAAGTALATAALAALAVHAKRLALRLAAGRSPRAAAAAAAVELLAAAAVLVLGAALATGAWGGGPA